MSTSEWIEVTPRLKEGVEIINRIENQKFLLLLNRCVQAILTSGSDGIKIFSEEEEQKLLLSLSVSKEQLGVLINTCIMILLQAVYSITKPSSLERILLEKLGLDSVKSAALTNTWNINAKKLIEKYKKKCIHTCQLEEVSWLVGIETKTSSSESALFQPKATLQLTVSSGESQTETQRKLNYILDESQLLTLFNSLESVQSSLNSIQSK